MGVVGSAKGNPAFLWDADALFQLLLCDQHDLLRRLLETFGVRSYVVPEVGIELRSNRKLSKRLSSPIRKAFDHDRVRVLDYKNLRSFDASQFGNKQIAEAVELAIEAKGRDYALRVHDGEAFSHATAVALGLPLVSNDFDAVKTLVSTSRATAEPTLRFFDVVHLAHQVGWLTSAAGDRIRQTLCAEAEHVPAAFAASSFDDGLRRFSPRLADSRTEISPEPQARPFQRTLILVPRE